MPKSNLYISVLNREKHKPSSHNTYSLARDEVIIYTVHLSEYTPLIKELIHFLNAEERSRANRYYKEKDRNQFVICRSILKILLAAHTKSEIDKINLDYDLNKKPFLSSHPWLHFNVSHSEDFALIAISKLRVGIDLEWIAKDFDYLPLLPDIFAENEICFVQKAQNKEKAFYYVWTRKEAFVKAIGKGINDDFKKVPVLNGEHSMESIEVKSKQNWHIYSIDLAEDYLAAVAFDSAAASSKNIIVCTLPTSLKDLLDIAKPTDIQPQ